MNHKPLYQSVMSRTVIYNGHTYQLAVATINPTSGEITITPFKGETHSTTYFDNPITISVATDSEGIRGINVLEQLAL